MGPNKVKYPTLDELGFLESKYYNEFSVQKFVKKRPKYKSENLPTVLSCTSTLPKWQTYKESGFKKHMVTLQARNTCAVVVTNIHYHTPYKPFNF